MDYPEFYTEIGKLAYAIARADGIIHSSEVDKICDFIGMEIEHIETDDKNSAEAVLQAVVKFNKLRNENASAKEAYLSFFDFIDGHTELFNQRIKNLCINISLRIASAHEGIDETERALIEKLQKKLDGING
ncbi:MAG: TerB family tellurite resistance protein [Lentimicrobium sp.]|jgi:hypothetical protein|nr:TerB family tellurite resistance protein [Lentimicrobium sp.]